MNSFGNHSSFPRMALGNLSNTDGNSRELQSHKSNLENVSLFPSKNSQDQFFPQSKPSKNQINTLVGYDAENSYQKGNFGKMEEDFSRKSVNKLRSEMPINPKSPESQKPKKSFVQLRAVTPQEKISDQTRHEQRRLSHGMPRENLFGSSYKINPRLEVNDNLDIELQKLPKRLNFLEEFGTTEMNCRFVPNEVQEEDLYDFKGREFNGISDMYDEKMNAMTHDFFSRDLNIFESNNYEETLQFPFLS